MSTRVLCVDDSATVRKLVAKALQAADVLVMEASNGREALELLDSSCHMVIVDANMPQMDGFEFVEAFRRKPEFKHVPVVFLTTESSESEKQRARELGANGWIVKPFKPDDLRNVVATFTSG
jgi:two-component system chemotaxis response regulator CheY